MLSLKKSFLFAIPYTFLTMLSVYVLNAFLVKQYLLKHSINIDPSTFLELYNKAAFQLNFDSWNFKFLHVAIIVFVINTLILVKGTSFLKKSFILLVGSWVLLLIISPFVGYLAFGTEAVRLLIQDFLFAAVLLCGPLALAKIIVRRDAPIKITALGLSAFIVIFVPFAFYVFNMATNILTDFDAPFPKGIYGHALGASAVENQISQNYFKQKEQSVKANFVPAVPTYLPVNVINKPNGSLVGGQGVDYSYTLYYRCSTGNDANFSLWQSTNNNQKSISPHVIAGEVGAGSVTYSDSSVSQLYSIYYTNGNGYGTRVIKNGREFGLFGNANCFTNSNQQVSSWDIDLVKKEIAKIIDSIIVPSN